MAEQKKINWLLILQGWAMLWVVIGHSFLGVAGDGPLWENALFKLAYSFHMPLFMLVSGWLFYLTRLKSYETTWGGHFSSKDDSHKWTNWTIFKDKTLRLLLPGLVFSIVALVLKLAFPGEMSRQAGLSGQEIIHSYLYPNDNPMRELWFIATLFWFFLLTPMWKVLLSNKWLKWMSLVIIILLHFYHPNVELLCIGRLVNYAVWFYLGLLISHEDYVDKYMTKQPVLISLIGIVVYVAGRYVEPFIATIGGIILSFGFALLLDKCIPKTFFTFRNYTYQIFLIGIFAQMFVKIMYRHISMPYEAAYVLCILMGLYVPVLVSKLIEKINWKPLSLCVGLKPIKK